MLIYIRICWAFSDVRAALAKYPAPSTADQYRTLHPLSPVPKLYGLYNIISLFQNLNKSFKIKNLSLDPIRKHI